jgi:hypothetical protein
MVSFSSGPLFSIVTAPGPWPKLDQTSEFSCLTHYDCGEGLFCSSKSLNQYAKGFRGGGGPGPDAFGCEPCKFCLSDEADPIDRFCPRDKCGSKAGSYPACVDATKLFAANFSCRDRYPIFMDRLPTAAATAQSTVDAFLRSLSKNGHKARVRTTYNQLVGAVIVTQRRFKGSCETRNDSVARYTSKKDPRLGPLCRGSDPDTSPFGSDPAFSPSSTLYRGNLDKTKFYSGSELDRSVRASPLGFFPHSYDGSKRGNKDPAVVMEGEESRFKLYFSEYLSSVQAGKLITYMQDGNFLVEQAGDITVEINTLNSNKNIFSSFKFIFTWKVPAYLAPCIFLASIKFYLNILQTLCRHFENAVQVRVYLRRFKLL